jgi:hypothetical protein
VSDDISGKDFLAAEGVEGWRINSDGASAFYSTASLQASVRLVDAIGGIDGIDEHPRRSTSATMASRSASSPSAPRGIA